MPRRVRNQLQNQGFTKSFQDGRLDAQTGHATTSQETQVWPQTVQLLELP